MTDPRNAGVGQRIGQEASFDGDPFPACAQPNAGCPASSQLTAHDRALEVLRVAFIDLDRMHADPTLGIIEDSATVSGAVVTRGGTASTPVLMGLRQTLLSVNGAITQYGAANPDPNVDDLGILNPFPIHPTYGLDAGAAPTFSQRIRAVFTTNAAFVRDVLTQADGSVVNGVTIANGVRLRSPVLRRSSPRRLHSARSSRVSCSRVIPRIRHAVRLWPGTSSGRRSTAPRDGFSVAPKAGRTRS